MVRNVRGKLELLKSKTKCHSCGKYGHWRRECPQTSSTTSRSTKNVEAEVNISEMMEFTEYEVHTVHQEPKKESEKKKKEAEDRWEVHRAELQVWRIHERPRRGMFVPTDAPDCPVSLDGITGQRETRADFGSGKLEDYHDFINRSNANRDFGATWTGVTQLKMKPEFEKTMGGNALDAHDLSLTEDDAAAYEEEVRKGRGPERNFPGAYITKFGSLFEHRRSGHCLSQDAHWRVYVAGDAAVSSGGQCVTWGRQEIEFRFGNARLIKPEWVFKILLSFGK